MRKPIIVQTTTKESMRILGCQVKGLRALQDAAEVWVAPPLIINLPDGEKDVLCEALVRRHIPERPISGLHVLEVCRRYPCFDADDYASEDRFFQNFFFSATPFSDEDINLLATMERNASLEFFADEMPAVALPSAYYAGEGRTIVYAL